MNSGQILAVCVAVRQGRQQEAGTAFSALLADTDTAAVSKAIGDCLLWALRRQEYGLFDAWLELARPRLLQLAGQRELAAQMAELWQRLAFGVSDRRVTSAQPVLALLLRRWLRSGADNVLLKKFWSEWLSLAARMARRGWRAETAFLLRQLLRWLLMQQDRRLWSEMLLQLELHFVVYAGWDGFARACCAWSELTQLQRLLLRRVQRSGTQDEEAAWLQLLLRHMRSIVSSTARLTMSEDMDVFHQWYSWFWQFAGADARAKIELQLLLQLAICYWQQTLPKTSHKQVRYLADLLQPSLINEHYQGLLQMI